MGNVPGLYQFLQIFSWALRELKNQKKWSLFFIFNLSVGLSGFIALDAFKTALQKSFRDNAKTNMAGDLSVGTRRLLNPAELTKLETVLKSHQSVQQISRNWELFSMALVQKGSAKDSRLVQVVAIDSQFPLYGQIQIERSGQQVIAQSVELVENKNAWVYPEILIQLNLREGEFINIGGENFKISGVVKEDPTQGIRFSSLSPKVYVGMSQLKSTKLIGYGTTMFDEFLVKLQNENEIAALKKQIEAQFPDPAIRIVTYSENAEEAGGALKYLSDYLGLVALVALFLAGLGSIFLFRSFLISKYYSIAIQNALGLSLNRAVQVYLAQLALLGTGAALFSLVGAQLLLPIISKILNEISPLQLASALPWSTVGVSLLMGVFGSIFIGYPFLRPIYRIRAQELLQESREIQPRSDRRDWLWLLPVWIFFWILSVIQSNSIKTGSIFFGIFIASLIFLWVTGFFILKFLNPVIVLDAISKKWRGKKHGPISWTLRHAFLSIRRRANSKVALIIAIGLGTILTNLLPQLELGLRENIASPEKSKVPSIFMFDIQQEQLGPLTERIQELGFELSNVSPLVRARIKKINDQDYERADLSQIKTREDEREARFRNRGVNLSYRKSLTEAENVTAGAPFPGPFNPNEKSLPQISVEERFANTMNIHLNDIITFDVQGIEVQGQVTSLRKVKWNSFQPNFFIQFQAGVLEDAPQTLLASISQLKKEQVNFVQSELSQKFPNVSMIDVGTLIDKIIEISRKMSWSLELMAYLSILAGFVILYSLASVEVRQRTWDLNMMKVFGSSSSDLFKFLLIEFGTVVFLGAFMGSALSFFVSYGISYYLFEGIYQADWVAPLRNIGAILLISLFIVFMSARHVILKRVKEFF